MDFEPVIGLELHLQLNSTCKLFSRAANKFTEEPNLNVDYYTFALPGTLPVLNFEAVRKALTLALALNCQINKVSYFDRKHYFYPDLPKGYQITQFYQPLAVLGKFIYPTDGILKEVPIKSIQLEEDAGKSLHDKTLGKSLVDLNRAGMVLVEVVTDPCFRRPDEAAEFLKHFRNLAKFLDISEANLEKGSLRCDANVSVRPKDSMALGNRVEIKNLNSFKFLTLALSYEIGRQIKELNSGREVKKETRGYNAERNITYSLRTKEELSDYRYMRDPDLPALCISEAMLDEVRSNIPELPHSIYKRLVEIEGVPSAEAMQISYNRPLYEYAKYINSRGVSFKLAINYLINDITSHLKDRDNPDEIPVKRESLAELLLLYQQRKITSKAVKECIDGMFKDPELNIMDFLKSKEFLISFTEEEVLNLVDQVISSFPEVIQEIKKQTDPTNEYASKRISFLVGQVMKRKKGLDPKFVFDLIQEKLGIR